MLKNVKFLLTSVLIGTIILVREVIAMIKKLLENRRLPSLLCLNDGSPVTTKKDYEKRKKEILSLYEKEVFGIMPKRPEHLWGEVKNTDTRFAAGKAVLYSLIIHFEYEGKTGSFPIKAVIPKKQGVFPAFVNIGFEPSVPNKYLPTEEIVDRGYAIFYLYYEDIVKDKCASLKGGIAELIKSGRGRTATGKIAMWAWAASRVADYALSLPEIDKDNLAVIGHSRLGKTALLAGAFDERFNYVISNNSGCTGAALSRGKTGETVANITEVFPFWFNKKYTEYASKESSLPLDQHFLLGASVPRHILVGSAEDDLWADPVSEFLSVAAVNEAYALYGKRGLVHEDSLPTIKDGETRTVLAEGEACYHIRRGAHYLSREDWNVYMDYIDKNREK